MGSDKIIICEDCTEYAALDKVPFPPYWDGIDTAEWFNAPNYRYQTMKLIAFIVEHTGHQVRYIPEASRYESLYFDVKNSEDATEFTLDRHFGQVKSETNWEE